MSRAMKDSGIPWIGEMLKENGFPILPVSMALGLPVAPSVFFLTNEMLFTPVSVIACFRLFPTC